jgi:hypothetical protein
MYYEIFYNLKKIPYEKVFDAWWATKKYKIKI